MACLTASGHGGEKKGPQGAALIGMSGGGRGARSWAQPLAGMARAWTSPTPGGGGTSTLSLSLPQPVGKIADTRVNLPAPRSLPSLLCACLPLHVPLSRSPCDAARLSWPEPRFPARPTVKAVSKAAFGQRSPAWKCEQKL